MNKLKGAVIGLRHGERHVKRFLDYENLLSCLCICDKDLKRTEPFKDNPAIISYKKWESIPLDLDFVVISLPNNLHIPLIQHFLNNSQARVICEKPLASGVEDISKLVCLGAKYFARVKVIHELRLNKSIQELKCELTGKQIKCISMSWHRQSLPQSDWYLEPNMSGGGVLIDLGIHLIDLLIYLLGDKLLRIEVDKIISINWYRYSIEKSILVQLCLEGVIIILDVSWQDGKGEKEIKIIVETTHKDYCLYSRRGSHRILQRRGGNNSSLFSWYEGIMLQNYSRLTSVKDALYAQQLVDKIYNTAKKQYNYNGVS